jgi:GH24 family phage-related lysozyme (muramidase)|tara:strand:- start:944 stop:1390 length:447 start_codon:yes stop_codon:yes gene_type:complete
MNTEICKEQIKRHEGEVLEVYKDSLGYLTLGVGHLIQADEVYYDQPVGQKVPQQVVDAYYDNDFEIHLSETKHLVDDFDDLPEEIQHVLVNMCFNLGSARLGKFKNMLKACQQRDWKEMAAQMEDSRWFKQVGRRSVELQEIVLGVEE